MSDRYTQRGTAQWRYSARPQHAEVLADGNARARWWAEALQALLSSLGRHSRLERASVTTGEQGEDAFELALRGDADLRSLVDYVAARQDFCALWLDATLQAVSPEGEDIALDYALTLDVVVEQTDDQQPVLSGEFPFDLTLALNADLYVEATFRGDGDNRALAP